MSPFSRKALITTAILAVPVTVGGFFTVNELNHRALEKHYQQGIARDLSTKGSLVPFTVRQVWPSCATIRAELDDREVFAVTRPGADGSYSYYAKGLTAPDEDGVATEQECNQEADQAQRSESLK